MARQACFTLDGRFSSIPTKIGEQPRYAQAALPLDCAGKPSPNDPRQLTIQERRKENG